MNYEKITPGTHDELNLVVEIPKGSRVKYEYDKELNAIVFDRVLHSSVHYPANYGFIPQTLCEDNDPLDGFVLIDEPLVPGTIIKVRAVGVIKMIDGDEQDNKLICVPLKDPRINHIKELSEVNEHFLKEVEYFLARYKDLEGKKVTIEKILGKEEAIKEIDESIKLFRSSQ